MVRVEVGSVEAGNTEIRSGINSEKDRIITRNAYAALMKLHNRAEE
jgi:hypothetical protein